MLEHLYQEHGRDPEWLVAITKLMGYEEEAFQLSVAEGWRRRGETLRALERSQNQSNGELSVIKMRFLN